MRVKRNTKKIIRRKGSKKNLKKHLKKYVGGAGMDEILAKFQSTIFGTDGKLTEEAKGNIGFLFSAALSGGTIWLAIMAVKTTLPHSYQIIVDIIHNIVKLTGYLPVETAKAATTGVSIVGSNLYYILKSLIALLWPWRYCAASAVLARAGPTIYDRTADTIQSIRGSSKSLETDIETGLTEIENNMTQDNFIEKVLDLIYWVIEQSNTAFLDTRNTISDIYKYFKIKKEINKEIDSIQNELHSAECGIGGKVESTTNASDAVKPPNNAEIKDNLATIIDNMGKNGKVNDTTETKKAILDLETILNNHIQRIEELKTLAKVREAQDYDVTNLNESINRMSNDQRSVFPFGLGVKYTDIDGYNSDVTMTPESSQDSQKETFFGIPIDEGSTEIKVEQESEYASEDEAEHKSKRTRTSSKSSDGEDLDEEISGGKKKKNTQKRRNKVSRKHRK